MTQVATRSTGDGTLSRAPVLSPASSDATSDAQTTSVESIVAIVSLLHEPADQNSATRKFRNEPVLRWTLQRLSRSAGVRTTVVLCWSDQRDAVEPIATAAGVPLMVRPSRQIPPEVQVNLAARRWSDGWRGGLLATCDFDRGFYGPWIYETAEALEADAVILVDPAAALIDAELIDSVIQHARDNTKPELIFTPAGPGLCSPLLRKSLLERLAKMKQHPGRVLHYHPDVIAREPLSGEGCAPVPTIVARTTRRFDLSSGRQIARLSSATDSLNGKLIHSSAEAIVRLTAGDSAIDPLPREVVLELNTRRLSQPIFWPGKYHEIRRPDLSFHAARRLINELAAADETRLTLAGIGDPLLSENVFDIIAAARDAGLAVHVETDLLGPDVGSVEKLAASGVDVVSVHLPALTDATYTAVMGVPLYRRVLEHLQAFVQARANLRSGIPIVVPLFTKCHENLGEMEAWYDQWLRAVSSAAIVGPSDFAGQIPDVAIADMAPPRRWACARLASGLTVLSDGQVVSCEQDIFGRQSFGNVSSDSIQEIWQRRMQTLRDDHRTGCLGQRPLCLNCREWHRP